VVTFSYDMIVKWQFMLFGEPEGGGFITRAICCNWFRLQGDIL